MLPTNTNKLLMQWKGACQITQQIRNDNYKIPVGNKEEIYYADMLRNY